jgi:hypothetical protein
MWDHIVRPGENLWLISRRFNKNLNEIFRLNPQIRDKTKIWPGMVVHMPDPAPQGDVIVGPITFSEPQGPAAATPGYYEIDIDVITNDPRTQPLYIDKVCEAVGYGIYVGGFLLFVPQGISPYPILVPESMVFFGGGKAERVSDKIFDSRVEAEKAAGGTQPMRVAYFWGAGGRVVCPTAFTIDTTPTIVNTASYVVDELVKEVQEQLVVLAISIVGAMVGGAILTRLMRVREAGPGSPPRMPQRRLEAAGAGVTGVFGEGTLTEAELAELQAIANKYDAELDVIGSRAAGKGRNIDKPNLPVGKGENTRSDIDVRIDGQKDIDSGGRLSNDIANASNGAGKVASSTGLPSDPPYIKIRPNQPPLHVK